jgi:hypothetical protein
VAQAPRLGGLGLAYVLRGALDGTVHEDKEIKMFVRWLRWKPCFWVAEHWAGERVTRWS